MKWHIPLASIAIGLVLSMASCIYMENPWGDKLYYGYPFLWLKTSKSLLVSFPPIPLRVNVLWRGFIGDMLLYSSGGFVVSYLVFTLRETMKLLRFFTLSGIVLFAGSFMTLFLLFCLIAHPLAYYSSIVGSAFQKSLFFSAVAVPASTVVYGYYELWKKSRV